MGTWPIRDRSIEFLLQKLMHACDASVSRPAGAQCSVGR